MASLGQDGLPLASPALESSFLRFMAVLEARKTYNGGAELLRRDAMHECVIV